MQLENFEREDYDTLYAYMLPMWQETYAGIVSPAHLDALMQKYFAPSAVEAFREKGYRYEKITDGGRKIGAVVTVPRGNDTYLDKLYVNADARGKGAAAFVFRALRERGRDVTLNVNRQNHRAVRCYLKNGFTVEAAQEIPIGDGMVNSDYVMRLSAQTSLRVPSVARLGIVGAMDVEVEGIVRAMTDAERVAFGGSVFTVGKIDGREVVAVQCGIGKVNAAFVTSALQMRFGVQAVLMTGVCGGVVGSLRVLDAVVPSAFVQHDVFVPWCADGYLDILDKVMLPADAGLAEALAVASGGFRGVMATGEQFIGTREQANAVLAKFPQTLAVDMESAAVAQVCARLGLPFACIKIVSDDGSADVYVDFKTAAAEKAVGAVLDVLSRL